MSKQENKKELKLAGKNTDLVQPVTQQEQYFAMVNMAMKNGDLDQVKQMMEMKREYEADEARKSYNKSFTEFKAECPTILKTSKGHNYKYADLGLMVEALIPVLARHGLTHSWSMFQSNDNQVIKVTCCLKHVDGHSECVSMQSIPDTSGSIKGIQGIASTKTYLERYTFTAITGLAIKGMDDDGVNAIAGAKEETITDDQAFEITAFIEENKLDRNAWLKWFGRFGAISIDTIPAKEYNQVMSSLKSSLVKS